MTKVQIIKIGNSQGIRIPKALIEQCGFSSEVELRVEEGKLIISKPPVREGWEESFREMAESGDDELLLGDFANQFDEEEWQW